jgi:four helix bundle protein
MSQSNFRNLQVWEKARVLAREVYRVTRDFPKAEMFGLTQQMRRAVVSVMCNIAEGQGRRSYADRRNFTVIARGSVLELEAQLVIALDLEYVSGDVAAQLIEASIEIGRMLNAMIRYFGTTP